MADKGARTALFTRVKNILMQPKTEWPVIDAEPATIGSLYTNYVLILAAIPALCLLVAGLLFGPDASKAVTDALLQYVFALAGVYVFALIIDTLAPRFGGRSDRVSAFKLAAYSATASWLAASFTLIPWLSILSLLGLYSLYLLYTGAPVLAKVPQERALGYTAAVVAVGMVAALLVVILSTCFFVTSLPRTEMGGTITLPGGMSLDTAKLEEATKGLEQATDKLAQSVPMPGAGGAPFLPGSGELKAPEPIGAEPLKALLPETLPNGAARSNVETWSGGAGGMAVASAKAVYGQGEGAITLSVIDVGVVGAFMALGTAFGANASEETETRYSKIGKVDGRMTIEEFDKETKVGKYATLVKDRIMVAAESTGASMDDIKAAVVAVDAAAAEALVK